MLTALEFSVAKKLDPEILVELGITRLKAQRKNSRISCIFFRKDVAYLTISNITKPKGFVLAEGCIPDEEDGIFIKGISVSDPLVLKVVRWAFKGTRNLSLQSFQNKLEKAIAKFRYSNTHLITILKQSTPLIYVGFPC